MSKSVKIVFAFLTVAIVIAYFGVKFYAEKVVDHNLQKTIKKFSHIADIKYAGVSVNVFKRSIHVKKIEIQAKDNAEKIYIDKISVLNFDRKNKVPQYLHIAVQGIDVNTSNIPLLNKKSSESGKMLKDLGYDKIKANIELNYLYKPKNKELIIKKLAYGAEKMGAVEIKLHVSQITPTPNLMVLMFTYQNILLHSAKVTYTDQSLYTRTLEKMAKDQGVSKEDAIKKSIAMINQLATKIESDELSKKALQSLQNFIQNPKQISIEANPKKPVKIETIVQMVQNYPALVKMLQINITN
ncbi:MAG: hypothetical protein ACI86H_002167 [bacterium]|jgi:hypothetical protein